MADAKTIVAAIHSESLRESASVLSQIDQIAADPSKTGKVEKVIAAAGMVGSSSLFVGALRLALDPFVTFGIARKPMCVSRVNGEAFGSSTLNLLWALAERRLTGNAARDGLATELARLDQRSAELLWRIVNKDLRAGFGANTVNEALGPIIPKFPYMRCSLPKHVDLETDMPWSDGAISQLKADGMFANVNVESDGVSLTSRQGTPIPMTEFGEIERAVLDRIKSDTQCHGELEVMKDGLVLPREIGNGMLNSVIDGGKFEEGCSPRLSLWDQIPLSAVKPKGKHETPYLRRYMLLSSQVYAGGTAHRSLRMIPGRVVRSLAAAYTHYQEMLEDGKEGTVIKHPEAIWRDGTSKQQIKMKMGVDCDLVILALLPGNGKNAATFGSILCGTSDGLLEVGVSGFTEALRAKIWKSRDSIIGQIMTVRFNGIMTPKKEGKLHSLFLPRHVEIRKDKDTADTLPMVIEAYESAKQIAAHCGK